MAPAPDNTPLIAITSVTKRFGRVAALDNLSLSIGRGEFFALLGPSGCGKTTLMRLIAGFETADAGRVSLDGVDIANTPPHRRPVNMMFQSYALFPHMTVERNIAFGLEREGMKKSDVEARVDEMMALTQIDGLRRRKPDQLSGGQRQRVALARALAKRPRLLLLDEPLAALDRKLREETRFELMRIQRALGMSFVLVTHDQDEAMVMADRVAVMREGRIEQIGRGRDLYDRPANRWVAGFIGEINLFKAVAMADAVAGADCDVKLTVCDATYRVRTTTSLAAGQDIDIAVRPECVTATHASIDGLSGEVTDVAFRGDATLMRVRIPSGFVARVTRFNGRGDRGESFARGDRVGLEFPIEAAVVLTS